MPLGLTNGQAIRNKNGDQVGEVTKVNTRYIITFNWETNSMYFTRTEMNMNLC